MATPGRWRPVSAHRRLVADLMGACQGIPLVGVDRRMDLSDLAEARRQAEPRPAWSVLLAKGFALVSAATPILRTSWIPFPWAHFHEHAAPVASLTVEREHEGEQAAFFVLARDPHTRSLADLNAWLRHCKEAPFDQVPGLRRARRLARLPWPLRGWMLRLGLFARGSWRERFFGTFVLSSPASAGAGLTHMLTPLTTALHFGLFDEAGRLDVRLSFDHRVMDGAEAARALAALEKTLRGAILDELRTLARSTVAA